MYAMKSILRCNNKGRMEAAALIRFVRLMKSRDSVVSGIGGEDEEGLG